MAKPRFEAIKFQPLADGVTVTGIRRSARGTKFYPGSVTIKGPVETRAQRKSLRKRALNELFSQQELPI